MPPGAAASIIDSFGVDIKRGETVALQVGDRVEEQARSTERATRTGTIEEVVHGDPSPRYRVAWDDGHESVYTPAAGGLHKLTAEKAK